MPDDFTAETNVGGVSPVRKKISAVVLCVLSIVLIIEARAGLGHMLSGKMLQEKSSEGVFESVTLEEFEPMLSLAPTRTTICENISEIEYKYSWFSLLRPLLSRPEAAYYVVVRISTPPNVVRYNTEAMTEAQLAAALKPINTAEDDEDADDEDGGGGGAGGGRPGGGRGPGGPPPQDPTVTLLDSDGNGELTEDELESASTALFAADKNGDGALTPDELRPADGGRPTGRQRPPADSSDDEVAPSEDEPTETAAESEEQKADDSPDDASEKTEPKPEPGETPASEKPAAE